MKIQDTNWNEEAIGLTKTSEELSGDMGELVSTGTSFTSQVAYAHESLKIAEKKEASEKVASDEKDADLNEIISKLAETDEGMALIKKAIDEGAAQALADVEAEAGKE